MINLNESILITLQIVSLNKLELIIVDIEYLSLLLDFISKFIVKT